MFWRYLFKSLIRNKTRSLLVMVGIIVSITLISGVNISTNLMARQMITESLDEIKIDFLVQSSDKNISANLARLNTLDESIDEFQGAFAIYYDNEYNSLIQAGNDALNWSLLENSTDYYGYRGNNTHFGGFQADIFTDPRFQNRFENTVRFNETFDPTRLGIYLDSDTARRMGIQKGQNVSFGIFTEQYVGEPSELALFKYEINNITIIDIFNILDRQELAELLQGSYGNAYLGETDIVILGNVDYLKNSLILTIREDLQDQIEDAGGDYYFYDPPVQYAVLVDHSALAVMDPNAIQTQITQMQNRIRIAGGVYFSVNSYLEYAIQQIQFELILYQVIFIIISIPVLILGWYLCKTNWLLSYQRRQREIALLKVKGGRSQQLKTMFFFEACIIGVFGGFFGIIGGDLTSVLVLQNIYPDVLETFTTNDLIRAVFTGELVTSSTWIMGILGGLIISLLAVRKPLNDYVKREAIEGLQKYHEVSRNELPRRKVDIVILIIGIVPLVITFITDIFLADNPFIFYNPFVSILYVLSTALLPIAPFALTYAVIKIICSNLFVFRGLISRVSAVFSRSISVFTSKSILRNQQRSFRLVFIVAMALSFMVMASTIEGTEVHYQEQITTLNTADGWRYSMYSPKFESDPQPFGSLMDYIWRNSSDFHIQGINWHTVLNQARIKGSDTYTYTTIYYEQYPYQNYGVGIISAANFTEFIKISDNWFDDITAKAAMQGLLEPNTAIIPKTMADAGYKVGDDIIIEYPTPNGSQVETTLEIIGIYKALPLVTSYYYQYEIIVNNATIPNGIFEYLDISIYIEQEFQSELDPEDITSFLKGFDSNGYTYYHNPREYGTDIAGSLLRFLNLESIYLLTIVSFGIGIIMYISVNEKAHDFGLLRARGVMKSIIYKIQLAEGSTLIFLGTLLSFPGILGAAAILLRLNSISFGMQMIERTIYIPWLNVLGEFAIALGVFFVSIIIAVALEIRKSNVSKIGEILRVDA